MFNPDTAIEDETGFSKIYPFLWLESVKHHEISVFLKVREN